MITKQYEKIFTDAYSRGFDKGVDIGYNKGFIDGKYEGEINRSTEIADIMVRYGGFSVEDIANITELSPLTIQKMKFNNKEEIIGNKK